MAGIKADLWPAVNAWPQSQTPCATDTMTSNIRLRSDAMTDDEIEALMRATYTSGYPDDLRRFVDRVRRDALEEAAKLCEARALGNLQLGAVAHPVAHEMLDARDAEAQCCAVAIRALVTGKTR